MNKNLIGNKEIFAIEYSILKVNPSPPYGDCLIWLGGNSLGGLEGEVYLNRVCELLEGNLSIKALLFLEEHIYDLSETEIFELMLDEKIDEEGKYWFLYTEGFDVFNKYIYRRNETFYFLWQLAHRVWKYFEPEGVSTKLFFAPVDISVYETVVNQFKNTLRELYKGSVPLFK
jgi:hypothetical protein